MLVLLDPGVDRLRRNAAIGIELLQPAFDLFRCPLSCQFGADELVDFGIIQFAHQRAFPPPSPGLLLGLSRVILLAAAVTSQLAADRRRRTTDGFGDLLLICSLMPQLCYAITLFQRKMTGHRWDSIPRGKVCKTSPIGNSQRCFSYTSFRGPDFEPRLHFKFETAT